MVMLIDDIDITIDDDTLSNGPMAISAVNPGVIRGFGHVSIVDALDRRLLRNGATATKDAGSENSIAGG